MLIISSLAHFQVDMITSFEPCSRFNTALLRVHMETGLRLCNRFNLALLKVHMITGLGPCSTLSMSLFRGIVVTDVTDLYDLVLNYYHNNLDDILYYHVRGSISRYLSFGTL